MLEDLDLLAQRLDRLVKHVRQLNHESADLRAELAKVGAQRDEFEQQLKAERAAALELRQSLGSMQTDLKQAKAKAQQDQSALQGTLDLFRNENEAMQNSLKTREQEVLKLREVTQQAKLRIDGVLERMPGGLSQEAS